MMSAMPTKPLTLLALCVTDQGNLALLKLICDSAEGRTFHGVNDGASKSQAPLMRACMHGCAWLSTWQSRRSPSSGCDFYAFVCTVQCSGFWPAMSRTNAAWDWLS